MGDVIELDDHRPHTNGQAVCLQCHHFWEAVAPVGAEFLQCPECLLSKGIYVAIIVPEEAEQCSCGNKYFSIVDGEAWCLLCGDIL